jgi:glycosyltransferase involved in cell wall biosynthesis
VVAGWRGGVDRALFNPSRASRRLRDRLSGGSPEAPLLLYVGRLAAEKGIELLLPVLDALPGARLAIVGDGPHRDRLELHFGSAPVTFAGYLHGETLAAAYASADAFVFPSRTDTLGLVLAEAMASGCPVVAARAGGAVDLVREGVDGLLFEPGDALDAAHATRRLLGETERRERFRAAALAAAAGWSWEAATAELRSHYQAVISSRPSVLAA